jgi:hypothetical protein
MDDLDRTARETEATIARLDHLLKQGAELLERSREMLGDEADAVALARSYIERQPSEHRAEYESEVEALKEEIERDLPRRTAARQGRVRPDRQLV